jgi:putative chitinase
MILTKSFLQEVIPSAHESDIDKLLSPLQREMDKSQINTPLRISHFIAQVAHESGSLRFVEENLNYSAKALLAVFGRHFNRISAERCARKPEEIANIVYANRMGNGNTDSGDGWNFRGRGLIQLTGRDNYTKLSKAYGEDYVDNPDRVARDSDCAVQAACWFWTENGLNEYADKDDVKAITRRINGGYNGLEQREEFLARAKRYFGLS